MSPEQRLGITPKKRYTLTDIATAIGLPNTPIAKGMLARRIDVIKQITPLTGLRGNMELSEKDFQIVFELEKKRKEKPTSTRETTPSSKKQVGEAPTRAREKDIILPNGIAIKTEKDSKVRSILREVGDAKQNGLPYTEDQIHAKREQGCYFHGERWIQYIISNANNLLRPYDFELTSSEVEKEGKKIRAFDINPKKTTPTSSPETQSPKA